MHNYVTGLTYTQPAMQVGGRQKAAKREIPRIIMVDSSYKENDRHKWRI